MKFMARGRSTQAYYYISFAKCRNRKEVSGVGKYCEFAPAAPYRNEFDPPMPPPADESGRFARSEHSGLPKT